MRIPQWTVLFAMSLVSFAQPGSRAVGPWKLGMTREEVMAVRDHGPYVPVRVTGGIETANGIFDGEKKNVAFVFGQNGGVNKIQVWAYEGKSEDEALKSWYRVYKYFAKRYGTVESSILGFPPAIDEQEFLKRSRKVLAAPPTAPGARMQMAPRPMPADARVFASFMTIPAGYIVFVNFVEP